MSGVYLRGTVTIDVLSAGCDDDAHVRVDLRWSTCFFFLVNHSACLWLVQPVFDARARTHAHTLARPQCVRCAVISRCVLLLRYGHLVYTALWCCKHPAFPASCCSSGKWRTPPTSFHFVTGGPAAFPIHQISVWFLHTDVQRTERVRDLALFRCTNASCLFTTEEMWLILVCRLSTGAAGPWSLWPDNGGRWLAARRRRRRSLANEKFTSLRRLASYKSRWWISRTNIGPSFSTKTRE
jgi:hypothetical protein